MRVVFTGEPTAGGDVVGIPGGVGGVGEDFVGYLGGHELGVMAEGIVGSGLVGFSLRIEDLGEHGGRGGGRRGG